MRRSGRAPSRGRAPAAFSGATVIAAAVARSRPPKITGWVRPNYRGRPVSLSGGAAAAAGVLVGAVAAGPLRRTALIAAGSAALAGGYDDLFAPRSEQRTDKGIAGHLLALRAGRLSGGVVKVILIGGGSLLAASQLPGADSTGRIPPWASRLVGASLIAGSANLLNLFDLRPGRAAKVALLSCGVIAAGGGNLAPLAAVTASTLVTLPGDLDERTMLGDLGANTVGTMIGVALATTRTGVRLTALGIIGALTIASERVSFSKVIAEVPALRWLDRLGRIDPVVPVIGEPPGLDRVP